MNSAPLLASLERFPRLLAAAVTPLEAATRSWRPEGGGWSVEEIVAHLADEEERDFPVRLRATLEDPGAPWEPIDPEGWVRARAGTPIDLEAELGRFTDLRRQALAWVTSLTDPDWARSHAHPSLGPLRAGDLLASWAAHDLLHLRQITARCHGRLLEQATPFDSAYAGPW